MNAVIEMPTSTHTGKQTANEAGTQEIWVFTTCEAGILDECKVFASEEAADEYALKYLAKRLGLNMPYVRGLADPWEEFEFLAEQDPVLDWQLQSATLEG